MSERREQGSGGLDRARRGQGRAWLRDWGLPAGLALFVGALLVLLASGVSIPSAAEPGGDGEHDGARVPEFSVVRLDALPSGGAVRESMRLLDPTPLFMPSSAGGAGVSAPQGLIDRPAGAAGAAFPPALAFGEQFPTRSLLRREAPASSAEAERGVSAERWFSGMSREGTAEEQAGAGGVRIAGQIDVYPTSGGVPMLSFALPPEDLLRTSLWRPMELTVLWGTAGAVSAPVLIRGSGVPEVDERIQDLVRSDLLPGLRLRPGMYRLVAGP